MDFESSALPLSMRLAKYKNYFYLGVLCLLLVSIFLVKLGKKKQHSETEFVSAMNAFSKWEEILDRDHELLGTLTNYMKKHPELKSQYEADLAQSFIAIRASKEAKEYGTEAIERTNLPYYSKFAEGSILICENKFEEALNQALNLKEALLKDSNFWEKGNQIKGFGSGLFAFNLLRIATLYRELSEKDKEFEAWNELKAYAGWDGSPRDQRMSQEGFNALLAHFTMQDITLLDYISMREKILR